MRLTTVIAYTVGPLLCAEAVCAAVMVRQNGSGHTTKLSGLYDDASCSPKLFSGKVVKREFSADAVTLDGFVIERPDGTRTFINVVVSSDLDMNTRPAVYDGLQRLTRAGRTVRGIALACGAGGRVLTVESLE